MSEKTPPSAGKGERISQQEALEQLNKVAEKLNENTEKLSADRREAGDLDSSKEIKAARESAEKLAMSGKETAPDGAEKPKEKQHTPKGVRTQTYKKTMNRIEAKLPVHQKLFSKVVHQPTVDRVSDVIGKTVARPSGILGGGIVAFTGLVVITYYATDRGFELSGTEFLVFVVVGWAAGVIGELFYKSVFRSKVRR